jgi:hypothetical protein
MSRAYSQLPIRLDADNEAALVQALEAFAGEGEATRVEQLTVGQSTLPVLTNAFWTAKQRAGHSLHEISYRACFKPQLPAFFIDRLTAPGDCILDPFMGRGTTVLESVLRGRHAIGCDLNPLSQWLVAPRLNPPTQEAVVERLDSLELDWSGALDDDLRVFYEEKTLRCLMGLRAYLLKRGTKADPVDGWIRMVATNRLAGHSPGFFSVYTMPPNQAVTVKRQRIINEKRNQTPTYRDVKALITRKSQSLLSGVSAADRQYFAQYGTQARLLTTSADDLKGVKAESVALVVTSPPFLDTVDYATDNWLRAWFNGIDVQSLQLWGFRRLSDWEAAMTRSFQAQAKVLRPGGWVAFEVGEVRKGKVRLEEYVIPAAEKAGLYPVAVLINQQQFTKTANCWGVDNQTKGTNTNRIILLRKPLGS